MTTTNNVNRQPDLQSLYDKAAQDIASGYTAGAAQATKQAAAAYAKQNPGSTVQDFEQAFAGAEAGKVSSSSINNPQATPPPALPFLPSQLTATTAGAAEAAPRRPRRAPCTILRATHTSPAEPSQRH